jgi:hypothetical protein
MVDRLSFLRLNEIARERLPAIRKSSSGRATKPPELLHRVVSFGTRFLADSWLLPG